MTNDDDRRAAAVREALEPLTDDKGLIARPIIDQWSKVVGTDYSTPASLSSVEAIRDGIDGTVWTPPTADAYFRACATIKRIKADLLAAERRGIERAAEVADAWFETGYNRSAAASIAAGIRALPTED